MYVSYTLSDFKCKRLGDIEHAGDPQFSWFIEDCKGQVPISSPLCISIYLLPNLFWQSVTLSCDTDSLNMNSVKNTWSSHIGIRDLLTIHYTASKVYCPVYKGLKVSFQLLSIHITATKYQSTLEILLERENHKLIALLTLASRGTGRPLGIPLGRAQMIETNSSTSTRTYRWEMQTTDNVSFPGMARPSSIQDLLDMESVKQGPLLSVRESVPYEPDNDTFTNEYRVLPVTVSDQMTVGIDFYNAKTRPAPRANVIIPWGEFVPERSPRKLSVAKSSKKDASVKLFSISEHLNGRVGFQVNNAHPSATICWIELVASVYHNTLHTMGCMERPLTSRCN